MRICVIPARGGSKRIPRKNIKEFFGQPIISYSINVAIASKIFDRVIVSTDDAEIAEVAKSFGADIPFMRSKELSDDFVGTGSVTKDAIEWFESQGQAVSDVCCIYATAPFVQADAINKAYQQMTREKADYCFTVTNFVFPIQRAIKITEDNRLDMFYPSNYALRSQDLEDAWHDAGQFYWGKAEAFKQQKIIFSKDSTPYILPSYLVQDIDTREDWKRAELMYQVLKQAGEID
ncbi:pseudaminic acid cytidylyltransferase [Pseudomonadales bacterium]|nr:pseudaminic acid cytidylyltransferase [Pseudomonadales bacterium]